MSEVPLQQHAASGIERCAKTMATAMEGYLAHKKEPNATDTPRTLSMVLL